MSLNLNNISRQDQSALLQSLKWIKENSPISEDGSRKLFFGIQYFLLKEIITRYTTCTSIPEGIHRRAISLAMQKWLINSVTDEDDALLSAFLRVLELEINQLKTDQQVFNVLMFLNVGENIHDLEPISILGDKLIIKTWNDLSTFRTEELWKEISLNYPSNPIFAFLGNKQRPRTWVFSPILLTAKSYVAEDAKSIAEDRFDILRAILNLSGLRESVTFYRSEPKQYSIFLPTPVLGLFDMKGNLVAPFRAVDKLDPDDYKKSPLKDTWLSSARRMLPLFEQEVKSSSIEHHILGVLRLYQQAIDLSSTESAFLGMWQVLESAVTFGSENISNQEIASRVCELVGLDPLFRNGLKLFTEMRNDYVHNGNFVQEGDDLLPTLKLIAENCIIRLISLVADFHTSQELRVYLQYYPLGDNELSRTMNVIAAIQKTRAAKSGYKPAG